ncbi:Pol polyprotein [Elysia marginata]|uniref:Pol polyprotein n=1 Tax=Elysia marginata TaxID=1093978 RepID=A0AAV4HNM2_9GAST|nr:Pol polyprotein [Elysia marginata]
MLQNPLLHQYWASQRHLTIVDDLLLYNDRIVIPRDMRIEMLNKLHKSHLGITKCRALAQTSVWWPNISSQIEDMVKKFSVCAKLKPATKEPLLAASFPDSPWSQVAMDLFDLHGKTDFLVVDYLSRWPEIRLLDSLTSAAVIIRLKSIFASHGIPDLVVSDNGPQFASAEFRQFSLIFGFTHTLLALLDTLKPMGKQSVLCKLFKIFYERQLIHQGTVRRNRSHLVATDASGQPQSDSMTPKTLTPVPRAVSPAESGSTPAVAEPTGGAPSSPGRPQVTTSGRTVFPPKKLDI